MKIVRGHANGITSRPHTRIKIEAEFAEGSDHRFVMLILKIGTAAAVIAFVWNEISKLF